MTEISMPWSGSSIGDCGPYTDDQWTDMQRKIVQNNRIVDGVILGYGNGLLVTNTSGTTIRVATGAALVDGKFYENTANIDFTIVLTPGTYYLVVLGKDFLAQEVRAAIKGPYIVSPDPVTQTDGVMWEIKIATIAITGGPTVTITDERVYISTTSPVFHRQGGLASDWDIDGQVNYYPNLIRIQGGCRRVIHTDPHVQTFGPITITFPKPFIYSPLVYVTVQNGNIEEIIFPYILQNTLVASCSVSGWSPSLITADFKLHWLAIGRLAL